MTSTTNRKLSADGGWAHYPGWSVIFDSVNGQRLDEHQSSEEPSHPDWIGDHQGPRPDRWQHGDSSVAVLPPGSHHVTICDGVNPAVLRRSTRSYSGTPRPHRDGPEALRLAVGDLLVAASGGLEFRASGIEVRNFAVVLALEPTARSRAAAAEIEDRRAVVLDVLGGLLGVDLRSPWRPHLTLAYRRAPDASPSEATLDRLRTETGRSAPVLRVNGGSVYEFDSMVSFHRVPKGEMEP